MRSEIIEEHRKEYVQEWKARKDYIKKRKMKQRIAKAEKEGSKRK
jgi:hypothetical protein